MVFFPDFSSCQNEIYFLLFLKGTRLPPIFKRKMAPSGERKHLTPREKTELVVYYQALARHRQDNAHAVHGKLSELVGDKFRVSHATVERVISKWRKDKDSPTKANKRTPRGVVLEDMKEIILSLCDANNKARLPTTSPRLKKQLEEGFGVTVTKKALQMALAEWKVGYKKGSARDIEADKPTMIKYRLSYIGAKRVNLNDRDNPIRPEVYLDETYCNERHVAQKSYLTGTVNYCLGTGKGRRAVIVGAGVYYEENEVLVGKMLDHSLEIWVSDLKNGADYHGNMNSDNFERWFEKLCGSLREEYGGCNVFMDGASYHERILREIHHPTPPGAKGKFKSG